MRSSIEANWRLYPRARDALSAVFDARRPGFSNGYLLLPAYIGWSSREGSGVYDPIQQRQLKVKFYRIHSDLTVDIDDVERHLDSGLDISALMIIHFFGRPDPHLEELVASARSHDVFVIEDAAHAYFSAEFNASCGTFGDAVLYSMHKMFDVPLGGVLKINTLTLAKDIFTDDNEQIDDSSWNKVFSEDLSRHSNARIRNYHQIESHIKQLTPHVTPLWEKLPHGTVPQSFPTKISNTRLRDSLYFGLKSDGFRVASLYHDLIEAIDFTEFPTSSDISQTIFNLPVDPWLSWSDLESMVKKATEIVGSQINL